MSDEWADEVRTEKRKGGIPKWLLWTCGTGCALIVLLITVVLVGGYVISKNWSDPEKVIPRIQKYLPCETWPEDYEPGGGEIFGYGFYSIDWPGGEMVLQPMGDRNALNVNLSPSQSSNFAEREREAGEIEIQGRTTRTLTFKSVGVPLRQMRVDISGARGPCSFLILSAPEGEDLPTDQLEAFLEPFDVWHDED